MYVPRVTGPRPLWLVDLLKDSDTYKGDSDGKRVARHLCWRSTYLALGGADRFKSVRVFTLASRRGGDISWLTAAGVPHENIVGCDRSASAAKQCGERWPTVPIVVGDAATVFLASEPKRFDCVMLDFCGPLGQDTIRTIMQVVRAMRVGAILNLGFMRGRERDTDRGFLPETRARRRAAASSRTARSMERHGLDSVSPQHLLGIDSDMRSRVNGMNERARKGGIAQHLLGGTVRVLELQMMIAATFPNIVSLEVLCTFDYQSSTDMSNGVPMTYVAFRKTRSARPSDEQRGLVRVSPEKLRRLALTIESDGFDAALMLDLPRGTVSAWKAHATRGTYRPTPDVG